TTSFPVTAGRTPSTTRPASPPWPTSSTGRYITRRQDRHDENTVIRHTGGHEGVRRVGLPHCAAGGVWRPSLPRAVPPGGRTQAEGGDDRRPLPDRLLGALSRRLHGHPRHRVSR